MIERQKICCTPFTEPCGPAYGGHPFCTPTDAQDKILAWLNQYPALSDEQAVRELAIPNLHRRIAELRKLGHRIVGLPVLMTVTEYNVCYSMVYALHRDLTPAARTWYGYGESFSNAHWLETVFKVHFACTSFNASALSSLERCILAELAHKMICAR